LDGDDTPSAARDDDSLGGSHTTLFVVNQSNAEFGMALGRILTTGTRAGAGPAGSRRVIAW